MTKATQCDNPMCSCDPCTCDDCACGVARLGDLERRVMEILWTGGGHEITGREVADQLPENAYTTVATVLDRLVHKGLCAVGWTAARSTSPRSGHQGAHTGGPDARGHGRRLRP